MPTELVRHRQVLATLSLLRRVVPSATVDGCKETARVGDLVFTLSLARTIVHEQYDGLHLRTINPSVGELDRTHLRFTELQVTTGTGDARRPLDKLTPHNVRRLLDGSVSTGSRPPSATTSGTSPPLTSADHPAPARVDRAEPPHGATAMPPLSLAAFKRRAAQCTTFELESHLYPHRSGPRRIIQISASRILAVRPGEDARIHTDWPKAVHCRIKGNRIVFLDEADTARACFTMTFPFTPDTSGGAAPPAPATIGPTGRVRLPAAGRTPLDGEPVKRSDGSMLCPCGATAATPEDWVSHAKAIHLPSS